MMKVFQIATVATQVAVDRKPAEFRIDVTGAAVIPAIHIPYNADLPVPGPVTAPVEFTVDGHYIATAGLYDDQGNLLGAVGTVEFDVVQPQVKNVNAVGGLTVADA